MATPLLWVDRPSGKNSPSTDRATDLIQAFAERHVVLTPRLANALTVLETADLPVDGPIWGGAFKLTGQAIGQEPVIGRSRFWRRAIPSFHLLVAEPILRRAMELGGGVALSGLADLPSRKEFERPHQWQELFDANVRQLLTQPDLMGRGFWIETAVRLQAAAWREAQYKTGHISKRLGLFAIPSETDPLSCRLLFEAEPEFPESFRLDSRRVRARQKSQRKRAGHRPKEGGVSGIRTSTFWDDLPDTLISELVLPSRLVVDRLLHEGLLVRHRPPYRQPKRDLLMIAFADRRTDGPGGAIVKAAWADAAIRLQILLGQMGMPLSDLVWAEAQATGLSADLLRVEEGVWSNGLDPIRLQGPLRTSRLFRSGLMPGFLDTASATEALPTDASEKEDLISHLVKTGLRRLKVRHRIEGGRLGPGADIAHRPADYARRIAFHVIPPESRMAERASTDWTGVRGQITATLARAMEEETRVIAIIPPRDVAPGCGFTILGDLIPDGMIKVDISPDIPAMEAVNQILGALSSTMISTVVEAVDAG